MAATSTETRFSTKQPSGGAGLTPIWIRLPRLADAEPGEAEADVEDADATARSLSQTHSHEAVDRHSAGARRGRVAPVAEEGDLNEDLDLSDQAPEYLRQLADRKRSAEAEADDELEEAPRKRPSGRRNGRSAGAGGFFAQILKAPYNVLAGIALVAVFVGLYACFRPATATEESLPEIEPGPSLSLDMGEPSMEPYVGGAEAVDPSTLYPEATLEADGSFQPAGELSGVASANYGAPPSTAFEPVTSAMPVAPAIGASASVPAVNASASSTLGNDPALEGLPLEAYPDTDPATYRYPADAVFELSPAVERTAEGDSQAPRAASLGDSLEKTPVR